MAKINLILISGNASADSESPSLPASYAIDRLSGFWAANSDAPPHWWKYDFGSGNEQILVQVSIKPWGDGVGYGVKDFNIEGSNDDTNWDVLYTDQHPNDNTLIDYSFTNTTAYRYYRIYLSTTWRTAYSKADIDEIYFYIEDGGIDSYTKLLIHADGYDASTFFPDDSDTWKAITTNGNAQADTSQFKFGSASILLDGNGDYLSIPDSDDWNFGSGDFTIDCWIRINSLSNFMIWNQYNGSDGVQVYYDNTAHTLTFWSYTTSSTGQFYCSWIPSTSQWYHLSFVRYGSNCIIFINGVSQSITQVHPFTTLPNTALAIQIGGTGNFSGYNLNGWIDEFRISKGIARWITDFIPPTSAYDSRTTAFVNGTASASNSGGGSSSNAFNGNFDGEFWGTWSPFTFPQWLKYDFGVDITKILNKYALHVRDDSNSPPTAWEFQGSNDDSNWTTLDTQSGISWSNYQPQLFTFSNSTAYRYYRLYITASSGGMYTQLFELEGFEAVISDETLDTSETLSLSDSWGLQTNPDNQAIDEILQIIDTWTLITNPEQENSLDTLNLLDSWNLQPNPDNQSLSETVNLSDNWVVNNFGTFMIKFQTKLYTILFTSIKFVTDLRTRFYSTKKYATKLYTQLFTSKIYQTDLRVKAVPITEVTIGTLDDFIVKLDGIELLDVDYNSLVINLNLNTTPSNAQFTLARRHDDLDKMLNGTSSIITAENKIEVFDDTKKLFTGYISEINADSVRDVVKITASDCRLKMSRASMELMYGGICQIDANHNGTPDNDDTSNDKPWNAPDYINFEKSIGKAFIEVMTSVGSLVSGYDSLPFQGSFVPEYVKTEKDYTSLIDELIRQTANCNWYIDENERLRFQKIGSGAIKALPLASLAVKRHPYDLIVDDIQLNRPSSSYAQSLLVKRGKDITQQWTTQTFSGWMNYNFINFMKSLKEKTTFIFHQRGDTPFSISDPEGGGNGPYYTGMNGNAIALYEPNNGGWISYPTIIVQWLYKNINNNLSDITVGSGLPKKTFYLNSYGRKISNKYYGEEIKVGTNPNLPYIDPNPTSDRDYLVEIQDENYDQLEFLLDLANFELSQNNKMQSSATLSLLLDAYEYYNLSFSDLINLSNTIQSGIYSNNNGFPLNIDNMQINCATRTVQLHLTNYSKSWYAKTKNYLTNYVRPSLTYLARKWTWIAVSSNGTRYTTG